MKKLILVIFLMVFSSVSLSGAWIDIPSKITYSTTVPPGWEIKNVFSVERKSKGFAGTRIFVWQFQNMNECVFYRESVSCSWR